MRIKIAQDKDMDTWDAYVSEHKEASPYHFFAWKKAMEEAYALNCPYFMALNKENRIIGILPSAIIQRPLLNNQYCSLPYCDRGEALSDSKAITDNLIQYALSHAEQENISAYDYRATLSEGANYEAQAIIPGQKARMILALPDNSETLLNGFKAKLRSQVKKAEKNGLTFRCGNTINFIDAFYGVFTQNMQALGSPTHSKAWFEAIREFYADNCLVSLVEYDDKVIGAGLLLMNGHTATVPWASTLRAYNRLAPNMLLYWSLLKFAADHGYQQFDFGRSTIGEGTYKFKQQWGAKPIPLNWITYSHNGQATADTSISTGVGQVRTILENIWRRLPLMLTIMIGSRVRKYISL